MDSDLDCLTVKPVPISDLLKDVQSAKHGGFPLIKSSEDHTLLGYVQTSRIVKFLETEFASSASVYKSTPVGFAKFLSPIEAQDMLDLSEPSLKLIDESVIHVVPETP